ncbi:MAG: hypothetical protein IKN43_06525, partial [Selenomonadaceae bacterium]|nr:hypothetical protein [Selenomonadaceae bacterium]
TVLLIGPGKSAKEANEKIRCMGKNNDTAIISVNYNYDDNIVDYIFCSNMRRFVKLDANDYKKCIATSNIKAQGVYLQVKYRDLMNNFKAVKDNAGLMIIRLLINLKIKKILLSGFDGYSHDILNNYANEEMSIHMKNSIMDEINDGMRQAINKFREEVEIEFLSGGGRFEQKGTNDMKKDDIRAVTFMDSTSEKTGGG